MQITNTDQFKTCASVCDNPESSLLDDLGLYAWHNQLHRIVIINPIEWYSMDRKGAEITVKELYESHANPKQKKLVESYRKLDPQNICLIIDSEYEHLLDGFHRLAALALNGITQVHALDLSQPK